MDYQFLNVRRDGPVEHLVLNRPDVRNAFNAGMIGELTAWAGEFARQSDAHVVVMSGAGKVFCAGADASWMAETASYSEAENLRDAGTASAMFRALDELPVPLIGRIHGAAIGGGAGLAAVCDIAIADEDAVFGFTEVKLGIVPAVISPFVLAKIGRSAARELFLSGARFPAARAYKIGLVHAAVPPADLDDTVARYVAEIASAGREAIAAAKTLIRDVWGRTAADATPITAAALAARRVSPEGQEGLRAFLEKRKPRWTS
jgi:methylglutaconyl-CoA hydratase